MPPDMTARGLTGQTVASQLLDKLSALQAATDSARTATSYTNNWGDDIKVEIPNTGISIASSSAISPPGSGTRRISTARSSATPQA
ncbi:MAG: hypothetical protein WDM89_15180 [Rhizomicrobium sp.]